MNIRGVPAAVFLLICTFLPAQPAASSLLGELVRDLTSPDVQVRLAVLQAVESLADPEAPAALLTRFQNGQLYLWNDRVVWALSLREDASYNKFLTPGDPVTGNPLNLNVKEIPLSEASALKPTRQERNALGSTLLLLDLRRKDPEVLMNAVRRSVQDDRAPEMVEPLQKIAGTAGTSLAYAAEESWNLILLRTSPEEATRLTVAENLGRLQSLRALPELEGLLAGEAASALSPGARKTLEGALASIREYQGRVQVFDIFKSALSSASILVLVAMGLSITFGLMGVINMAHGEMLMVGAYTTYCMQLLFGHTPENPVPLFFFAALPASFLVSALVGGLVEWAVIKRLYRRPIESLLATYGVSLILIQVIRLIFGDNRATNSPSWLQGAVEVANGMAIPVNRIFILALALAALVALWLIFRYTRLGLDMKATMQNREMAASMGINTRKVDNLTFMLGSGIAGIAGFALTTVGGITPDMGKNYLVDSFLVVVTGGVGNMAGVVSSSTAIGFLNKILEGTFFGAVWAKIIVLALVIAFIQFKPKGLFAPKGRLSDD